MAEYIEREVALSKLSDKCQRCPYKNSCQNKCMMLCGVLELSATEALNPNIQDMLVKHDYRDVKIDTNTIVTIDLEDIKKRIKDDIYKNLTAGRLQIGVTTMREILFRGRGNTKYNDGEWYYGVPIRDFEGDWQICTDNSKRTVIPETIGQYTGLADKNGTKIFEGDIVDILTENEEIGVITWADDEAMFIVDSDGWYANFDNYYSTDLEVIGDIHDNPELLGGK